MQDSKWSPLRKFYLLRNPDNAVLSKKLMGKDQLRTIRHFYDWWFSIVPFWKENTSIE